MKSESQDGGLEKDKMSDKDGQKFYIEIEGTEYPLTSGSLTTEQIRELGKIPADQPIVEENPDGTERTLRADETIQLKPGHRFGRAPRYKRG
jgi:hypothetical protein